MTRKFKMAGVLMAVVAMFALTASAAQAQFTSAAYPATISAKSTADVFDAFGSTVKCTENSFSGTLSAGSNTLTINPTYTKCTAFGLPATVNFTSCDFKFEENPARAYVECTKAGDTIDITVYSTSTHATAICHVTIGAQGPLSGVAYANSGSNVILSGNVGGIVAKQSRTNAVLCPPGTETNTATYTIQAGGITVSGNNGAVSVD